MTTTHFDRIHCLARLYRDFAAQRLPDALPSHDELQIRQLAHLSIETRLVPSETAVIERLWRLYGLDCKPVRKEGGAA